MFDSTSSSSASPSMLEENETTTSLANLKELSCPVCLEAYNNLNGKPVSLVPCGHSVCGICVEKLNPKSCPTCTMSFTQHMFNWTVISLLPKPTLSQLRDQTRKSVELNEKVLGEIDTLTKASCFESIRREINTKHEELVADLLKEKNALMTKVSACEKRFGLDDDKRMHILDETMRTLSELDDVNIDANRFLTLIRQLDKSNETLSTMVHKLKSLNSNCKLLSFRQKNNRFESFIGEVVCNYVLYEELENNLTNSLFRFPASNRGFGSRSSPSPSLPPLFPSRSWLRTDNNSVLNRSDSESFGYGSSSISRPSFRGFNRTTRNFSTLDTSLERTSPFEFELGSTRPLSIHDRLELISDERDNDVTGLDDQKVGQSRHLLRFDH